MTDIWKGEPLGAAAEVRSHVPIHYRIHDADHGALLAFGTARPGPAGWLQVVDHYERVRQTDPSRALVLRQYDRPAGEGFGYEVGPSTE